MTAPGAWPDVHRALARMGAGSPALRADVAGAGGPIVRIDAGAAPPAARRGPLPDGVVALGVDP